jgi:hypothetical protein
MTDHAAQLTPRSGGRSRKMGAARAALLPANNSPGLVRVEVNAAGNRHGHRPAQKQVIAG